MKFQYAPELIEEVVFQGMRNRQENGDSVLFDAYHRYADRIYDDFSGSKREAEFDKLHRTFFVKLGLADVISQSVAEFDLLSSRLDGVFVGKAISNKEEGADLSKDRKGLGIKLRTSRFFELPFLQRYLRHELMHVADMLDEQFEYEYRDGLNPDRPAEEHITRERYRVLWDIYIDSRILRAGNATVSEKSKRLQEFAALYQKFPDEWIAVLFETLWTTERFTHRELLEMARDVQQLLARLPNRAEVNRHFVQKGTSDTVTQLPGSPCPLCGFPTYVWNDDIAQLGIHLQTVVREDYPDWQPAHGMCERCFEGYQVEVKPKSQPIGVRHQT